MRQVPYKHHLILKAYIDQDRDGDMIVIVETTAALYPNEIDFDISIRESIEREWIRLFHEHQCAGGKLIRVKK